MRLAFSSLLTFVAIAAGVAARATAPLHARSTTDTCGNINGQLSAPFLGVQSNFGFLSLCLCISGIPALLDSNQIVKTAVAIVGASTITNSLTDMVNNAKDHKKCVYPDHAQAVCASSNPCGFNCKDGFTPSPSKNPTDCVCLAPFKVCNGVCGKFGPVCPSSPPKKREAEVLERRAQASCDAGFTACGVYGWQGLKSVEAWECIDTTSDLESCGGCTIAFGRNLARGVDCTAIPGVMDVSCAAGNCIVHRCTPGYTVSMDRSYCIRKSVIDQADGDISAAEYGLEHVPLKRSG